MSDQRTDNNKKLQDLLNTAGKHEPADDFEKDAGEGFAMLGSNEEALKLKKQLDARMQTEVLAGKKSSPVAWLAAAAGLLLLIGGSSYFLMKDPATPAKNLAVVNEPKHEAPPPAPAAEPLQETTAATQAPAVEKPAAKHAVPAPSAPPVIIEEEKQNPISNKAVAPQTAAKKMRTENSIAKQDARLASSACITGVQKEEKAKAQNISTADQEATAADVAQIQTAPAAEMDQRKESGDKNTAPPAITLNPAARYSTQSAGAVEALIKTLPACVYAGGDATLQKDLKEKLAAKNLLQKFDATLHIDKNNAVSKANISNGYELSKTQKQEVIEILKSLDKFKLSGQSSATYKLEFRP